MPASPSDTAAEHRRRPVLHFTPSAGWMNDPNGLVEADGVFHLCYQHNPDAPVWGNLHWGHAVSTDLIRWEHRPVAIAPDVLGQAFSGSAVLDVDGTAGFGVGALVAIYTQDLDGLQRQSIAFSTDDGHTWKPHADNPVIDNPTGEPDFRDPTVLRTGADGEDRWMMMLAVGPDLWAYRSRDLRQWERTSTVSPHSPWPGSTAEVPELIRLPIEGTDDHVWVLVVSWIPGTETDGSARVRYSVVDVDVAHVELQSSAPMPALDHGRDFYAPMAWDRGPDHPPVLIGWLDERSLDAEVGRPSAPWCGRMSLPREVTAIATGEGVRVRQRPILPDSARRRRALPADGTPTRVDAPSWTLALAISCVGPDSAVDVAIGAGPHHEIIALSAATTTVTGRSATFETPPPGGRRTLDLVVDAGSIERFVDDGLEVMSDIGPFGLETVEVTITVHGNATVEVAEICEHDAPDPTRGGTA